MSKKIMDYILTIRRFMDKVLPFFGVIFISLATIAAFIGIIVRNFTTSSLFTWVDEFTRYFMIWGTLLVVGINMRKGLMTSFDLVIEKIPGKLVIVFKIIIHLFILLFYSIIFYFGLRMAIINKNQVSFTLNITMFLPYLIMPISSILIVYEGLTCLYELLYNQTKKYGSDKITISENKLLRRNNK